MMTPPLRSERRTNKLARRRSESMLGSPLELSIPPASRSHHPLTPFPFESKFSARQQKAVKGLSQSLAGIIDEEPSVSHAQPVLESNSTVLSYDDSSSNSEKALSPATMKHDLRNDGMTHYVGTATSQSRAYARSPNLQARFNTVVRKASQLCAMSDSEVYLAVRHGGSFYVYNSVDMDSHHAPEPEANERIITVAVASSSCGMTV